MLVIYFFGVFISIIGGPLINVFLRVYFDVFRQTTRFKNRTIKRSLFNVFDIFVDRIGRGTPDKRITGGLI